jgi:hypothetical protein
MKKIFGMAERKMNSCLGFPPQFCNLSYIKMGQPLLTFTLHHRRSIISAFMPELREAMMRLGAQARIQALAE